MTAKEAARITDTNAEALRIKEEAEKKKKAIAAKKANIAQHKKWYDEYKTKIRLYIQYRIEYGSHEYTEVLSSASHPKQELYGEDNYLKHFEYAEEFKKVLKELEDDGYQVKILGVCKEHDDSVAYMNSGGECGSEESYLTYDTVLQVTW